MTVFSQVADKLGSTSITVYANTDTNDAWSGQKTDSFGTGTTITGVFLRRNSLSPRLVEGAVEEGDAYLMVAYDTTINKDDRLKYQSQYYLVANIPIIRYQGTTAMYKFCTLTFLGDA